VKRRGPSTEPCGTPRWSGRLGENDRSMATDCERWDRYDESKECAELEMPKHELSLLRRMLWSIVSKAAERSRRTRAETRCLFIARVRSLWILVRAVSVE